MQKRSAERVKVLKTWESPFAMRVLIALEEKGISYELQEENMRDKSRPLLQMDPIHKQIPVLLHNGKPLAESLIILQYIDEAWPSTSPTSPEKRFMPSTPYDRAITRFWAEFMDKKIYEAGRRIIMSKGEAQEEAKRELVESLMLIEGALKEFSGGKTYFGGETLGFLDIAFIPLTGWFYTYETLGKFKIPLEDKCPCLKAWMKACMEKDSIKRLLPHPEKILKEYAIEFRKKYVRD
jgi:glutathione S-transferase